MPPSTTVTLFETPRRRPRLPVFERAAQAPLMRLTDRDKRILEAVHSFDGLLADYQIRALFFTGKTQMQIRTKLLFQHGYLARPDRRRRAALPCMVYWLTQQGAAYIAGLAGQARQELVWRREPKWSQIEHDLSVNDLRITIIQTCRATPALTLEQWIPQSAFWAYPDTVEYVEPPGKTLKRRVRPDGYCVISLHQKRFRLLWELDRRTEDNPRFVREKVYPGLAYLRSAAYRQRFGYNAGKWLLVTTGERRLANMKRQTEQAVGRDAKVFYFTTLPQINPDTILTAPIWLRGGETMPRPLFTHL
ncbi:MAG: hypothetical protein BroJett038_26390 [Chloroflexota bacterium]|nr:MAG: hypothetical protein BroJett038_26390 [Chloroflexota bacterium]